jgi:hypothetical protein
MGHETTNWGGRGLGYMLFNEHLCNQPCYCQVETLCAQTAVRRVSGVPSTDGPGAWSRHLTNCLQVGIKTIIPSFTLKYRFSQ